MGCSSASGYVSGRRSALSVSPAAQQCLGRVALDRCWHPHLRRPGVQCCGALGLHNRARAATTVRRYSDTLGPGRGRDRLGQYAVAGGADVATLWLSGGLPTRLASPEPHPAIAGLALCSARSLALISGRLGCPEYPRLCWSRCQPATRGGDATPWTASVGLMGSCGVVTPCRVDAA